MFWVKWIINPSPSLSSFFTLLFSQTEEHSTNGLSFPQSKCLLRIVQIPWDLFWLSLKASSSVMSNQRSMGLCMNHRPVHNSVPSGDIKQNSPLGSNVMKVCSLPESFSVFLLLSSLPLLKSHCFLFHYFSSLLLPTVPARI